MPQQWVYRTDISLTIHPVLFLSRPRSEGLPHHGRTFFIYLYPLSFWLTLSQRVLSMTWCCLSRPCVVFLACVHLALFLALFLSPGNSLVSSWCDHSMLASSLWQCLAVPSLLQLCWEPTHLFPLQSTNRYRQHEEITRHCHPICHMQYMVRVRCLAQSEAGSDELRQSRSSDSSLRRNQPAEQDDAADQSTLKLQTQVVSRPSEVHDRTDNISLAAQLILGRTGSRLPCPVSFTANDIVAYACPLFVHCCLL